MSRSVPFTVLLAGILVFALSLHQDATAQGTDDPAQVEAGQVVFETACAGCHGVDGTGVEGFGRSLIGVATEDERSEHIESVTNGKGFMPAQGELLSAEEIEQAVSYVRLTFVADDGATDQDADAQSDEDGDEAESDESEELAETGATSGTVAVVAAAIIAAGLQLTVWSRRHRD